MCGRGEYPWDASSLLRPMALTQHVGPPGSYWAAALGGDLLPASGRVRAGIQPSKHLSFWEINNPCIQYT